MTYFHGFKHANFVDLIWPFGSSGRSWGNLGWPWELQRRFGELRGGLERKGPGSGGLQGAPRNRKTRFWRAARFSQDAPEPTFIVVLAISSKFVPWPTFAAPGRSKRTPMGPDQLSRGPPGRPLERKTHLWRPSLSLPGKPIGLSLKKTLVFEKIAKTTINVGSGASWEKRAALQNRVFRFLGAP